jgi:hypothetical protein
MFRAVFFLGLADASDALRRLAMHGFFRYEKRRLYLVRRSIPQENRPLPAGRIVFHKRMAVEVGVGVQPRWRVCRIPRTRSSQLIARRDASHLKRSIETTISAVYDE